ncbi:NAD(P)-dependent dehydrogenase (short-subunit alcohol dehydrogenase family) [Mycolicibacterium iranicum]|uniref:NAD(P)-dependent dehydrogenase (Short-subunit alcohol dehydrogenase family) n=1 Tax=Mycolicibacterium iranicum TaxID=912594 RepID=A0A839QIW7_MYCIR|nr:SDR family NAD(P)-dependent oxidoreductase [Mycolicibacterium iranicum]MBB2993152.1 NAD(P)-dependent dehydrogenase (short-subunit alcohol dehydrogenase family) [Mycolicibacterium iranicum]
MTTTSNPTALDIVDGVDLSGKTCVITGASSGLGRESARALARTGAHVILAARNTEALAETEAWVRGEVRDARLSLVHLDLTSLASVAAAASEISELTPAVHVLMNNAGVMFTPLGRTTEGFETQFGTNHLGHFELTRLLFPALVAADGARVVVLSSAGHRMGDVDFDDPNWERRDYDKFEAYGASKTANVLHAVELDRRLRDAGVRAFAVHPGIVATALARHMTRDDFDQLSSAGASADPTKPSTDVRMTFTSPDYGAATQVWAAVSSDLDGQGGVYLADCRIRTAAPYAVDEARALELWALSEQLCTSGASRLGSTA